MQMIPHLCADEEFLALNIRVRLQEVADSFPDLCLVLVVPKMMKVRVSDCSDTTWRGLRHSIPCAVKMAVADFQSMANGSVCLAGGILACESSKAKPWEDDAVV